MVPFNSCVAKETYMELMQTQPNPCLLASLHSFAMSSFVAVGFNKVESIILANWLLEIPMVSTSKHFDYKLEAPKRSS